MSDEPITPGGGETEPAGDQTPQPKEQVDVQSLQQQKEHWREKAEKLAKEKADLEARIPTEPKSEVDFLETAKVAKKYDESELEVIANYAKKTGLSVAQAEKDDVVQLAIEAKRAKIAKESAIPAPSGANLDSTSYKKVSEMTREEHMQYEKEKLAERGSKN